MNDDQKAMLEVESALGDRYKKTFDDLIEPYFARKQLELFDLFTNTPSTNSKGLVEVRMQHGALMGLREEFTHYIETGKMASQQLATEEDNNGK